MADGVWRSLPSQTSTAWRSVSLRRTRRPSISGKPTGDPSRAASFAFDQFAHYMPESLRPQLADMRDATIESLITADNDPSMDFN